MNPRPHEPMALLKRLHGVTWCSIAYSNTPPTRASLPAQPHHACSPRGLTPPTQQVTRALKPAVPQRVLEVTVGRPTGEAPRDPHPLVCPLTRTDTHSLTYSVTHHRTTISGVANGNFPHFKTPHLPSQVPHSLTHSLTHPLTHSLTHSHTHSLTHSLTPSLAHSLTHSLPRQVQLHRVSVPSNRSALIECHGLSHVTLDETEMTGNAIKMA